jgi:hypothetical protein
MNVLKTCGVVIGITLFTRLYLHHQQTRGGHWSSSPALQLAPHTVSLHDEKGQTGDIIHYIK